MLAQNDDSYGGYAALSQKAMSSPFMAQSSAGNGASSYGSNGGSQAGSWGAPAGGWPSASGQSQTSQQQPQSGLWNPPGYTQPQQPPRNDWNLPGYTQAPQQQGQQQQPAGNWDTNGYATPGYVAPRGGQAPAGWDATKWNNASLQDPKYVVGGILNRFPRSAAGLQQAMQFIAQAYPGARQTGDDTVWIPGVGEIDVLTSPQNGSRWWWGVEKDANGNPVPQQGAQAAQGAQGGDPYAAMLQALFANPYAQGGGYAAPQQVAQAPAQPTTDPQVAQLLTQLGTWMQEMRAAQQPSNTPRFAMY